MTGPVLQEAVPPACPPPPRELDQITREMASEPEAVPAREVLAVDNVQPVLHGVRIVIWGGFETGGVADCRITVKARDTLEPPAS